MSSLCNLLFALTGRGAGNRRTLVGGLAALFALAIVGAHISTDQAWAVEKLSVPNGSAQLPKYRRLFVPADDAEAWPLEWAEIHSNRCTEFHELISAANGASSEAAPRATISRQLTLVGW